METPEFMAQEIAAELIGNGWQCRVKTAEPEPMPLVLVAPQDGEGLLTPDNGVIYHYEMVDHLNKLNPEAARLTDEKCRKVAFWLGVYLEDYFKSDFSASVANAVGRPDSEPV